MRMARFTQRNADMYSYVTQQYFGEELNAVLSADWDTRRDACLAAKLRFNLTDDQYNQLIMFGRTVHGKIEIKI